MNHAAARPISRDLYLRLALSWCWFFLVLLSYYLLKPLRDALATNAASQLGNLFLATFLSTIVAVSVYSKLVAIVPRRMLVLSVYQFFAVCLIGFGFWLRSPQGNSTLAVATFFVWVSV